MSIAVQHCHGVRCERTVKPVYDRDTGKLDYPRYCEDCFVTFNFQHGDPLLMLMIKLFTHLNTVRKNAGEEPKLEELEKN